MNEHKGDIGDQSTSASIVLGPTDLLKLEIQGLP